MKRKLGAFALVHAEPLKRFTRYHPKPTRSLVCREPKPKPKPKTSRQLTVETPRIAGSVEGFADAQTRKLKENNLGSEGSCCYIASGERHVGQGG